MKFFYLFKSGIDNRIRITLLFQILVILITACSSKPAGQVETVDREIVNDDSIDTSESFELPDKTNWNYTELYGVYEHESNGKGFTAVATVRPEGNDVWIDITVKRPSCSGQADGLVGIAVANENEYAGFIDLADCRMEVYFNRVNKTIRIQEIGYCRLYEPGCSFAGTYNLRPVNTQ
jgi:hypothetical protein